MAALEAGVTHRRRMKRENQKLEYIWDAMIQERNYQDLHKGQDGENKHDIPGWILIIKKQLDTAAIEWLAGNIDQSLAEVLQATAVGVACLQQHGVPDAALRKEPMSPQHEATLKSSDEYSTTIEYKKKKEPEDDLIEVTVKGFEQFKTYNSKDVSYPMVRISDMPEKAQDSLKKFMRGQTQPLIEGQEIQDFIYLHDFENFLAGGRLFWD